MGVSGTCDFKGCRRVAKRWADSFEGVGDERLGEAAAYCEQHASKIALGDNPEYIVDCPNCGCRFGVG